MKECWRGASLVWSRLEDRSRPCLFLTCPQKTTKECFRGTSLFLSQAIEVLCSGAAQQTVFISTRFWTYSSSWRGFPYLQAWLFLTNIMFSDLDSVAVLQLLWLFTARVSPHKGWILIFFQVSWMFAESRWILAIVMNPCDCDEFSHNHDRPTEIKFSTLHQRSQHSNRPSELLRSLFSHPTVGPVRQLSFSIVVDFARILCELSALARTFLGHSDDLTVVSPACARLDKDE